MPPIQHLAAAPRGTPGAWLFSGENPEVRVIYSPGILGSAGRAVRKQDGGAVPSRVAGRGSVPRRSPGARVARPQSSARLGEGAGAFVPPLLSAAAEGPPLPAAGKWTPHTQVPPVPTRARRCHRLFLGVS